MGESSRVTTTKMAWAIVLPLYRGFAGHGWFGWLKAPHVQGCRVAFFETRREARECLKTRRTGIRAHVVRVRITIEEAVGERIGIITQSPFDDLPTEQVVDCACIKDGLAVHQYPLRVINNWTVTHIPSGLAIGKGGESREDALAAMEELLSLADWSQDRKDLPTKEIGKEARRIIERHGMVRVS